MDRRCVVRFVLRSFVCSFVRLRTTFALLLLVTTATTTTTTTTTSSPFDGNGYGFEMPGLLLTAVTSAAAAAGVALTSTQIPPQIR